MSTLSAFAELCLFKGNPADPREHHYLFCGIRSLLRRGAGVPEPVSLFRLAAHDGWLVGWLWTGLLITPLA
jgi:hypothetical protein